MGRSQWSAARLLYVAPVGGTDGTAERLRGASESLSVVVAEGLGELEATFDPAIDCVLTLYDLGDGTGFDVHDRLNPTARRVPLVLLASETTGEIAAEAVARDLAAYVPIDDSVPIDRVLDAIDRALGDSPPAAPDTDDLQTRDDRSEVRWKADLLDQLFSRVPVHLFVKDEAARHVLISEMLVDDPEKYLGQRDVDSGYIPPEEARAAYEDDLHVIETGEPIVDKEEYYDSLDRWFLTSKVPMYDADGDVVGLIGASREITRRKRADAELERINEHLERFVSFVSHDLRSPLNVATGEIEVVREHHDSEHLDHATEALERMESLIDDLLALARQGRPIDETEPVSVSTLAERSWRLVDTADATLVVDGEATVQADPTRLQQLLENCFRNSVEHGSTDNRPEAIDSVERGSTDEAAAERRSGLTITVGTLDDGFYVADDGIGISESDRALVSESGYPTNPEGTGFGLAIIDQIVDAHGWTIAVEESQTGGARFEIRGVDRVEE